MTGAWEKGEICPVNPAWLRGYDLAAIADSAQKGNAITWWDKEVVELLRDRGPKYFSKLAIWNHDWNAVARRMALNGIDLADPRSGFEKIAHAILLATQSQRRNYGVRAFERLLRLAGW
jgi:hypothetical protein